MQLLEDVPLTADEAVHVDNSCAAHTMRGYRSDWREFTSWCSTRDLTPMPAVPATIITNYLTELALSDQQDARLISHFLRRDRTVTPGGLFRTSTLTQPDRRAS